MLFGGETIEFNVVGNKVSFRSSQQHNSQFVTLDNLRFDYSGVIKEFPDLENNPQWNELARERFMEYLKTYKTEADKAHYIVKELAKYGYVPRYIQKSGFRPEVYNATN